MLNLREVYGLVEETVVAAGNAVIPRPHDAFRHLFLVTIATHGDVWVEAAVTPVLPGVARWVSISGKLSATDSIAIEGNFPVGYLRVCWENNDDTISVDLIQSAQQPDIY